MNPAVKAFSIIVMVSMVIHFAGLMLVNRWRIVRLRRFIEDFKSSRLLSDHDYELLYNRYHGGFNYLEFFPNKEDFPAMYTNKTFDRFVTKTRLRMKYFFIATLISLLATILFVPGQTGDIHANISGFQHPEG